jgi:hypothetical protein
MLQDTDKVRYPILSSSIANNAAEHNTLAEKYGEPDEIVSLPLSTQR